MPVMLYKMIIATAVVGDRPRTLLLPESVPVLFVVDESTRILAFGFGGFACSNPNSTMDELLASVIVYNEV